MRVSVSGTGYVGIIQGASLAKLGNDVVCIDIDKDKVNKINDKKLPIFEEGLQEIISEVVPKRLKATTNLKEAILNSEITFICVGTPSMKHGEIKLHQIEAVSKQIAEALKEKKEYHLVVIKSTVVPGTTEKVVDILEKNSGKKFGKDFGVAMNPEFLREGTALRDFFNPDRIVIGSSDKKSREKLKELYRGFKCPVLETSFREAEMIKYASNAFLATKISFINEIGNICKKMGIDTNLVAQGVGMDYRISPHFFRAGIGFGGSCFSKDVAAIVHKATEIGYHPRLLRAVLEVNRDQPAKLLELLEQKGSDARKIAILGLTFKADTDDVRESPSLTIIKELLMEGKELFIYDPMGMSSVMQLFPHLNYSNSAQEAVDMADIVLVLTEWPEFKDINYGEKLVIDGKNLFSSTKPQNYEGVCW